MAKNPTRASGAWAGWVTFAACMMLVLGVLNLFQGFVALFRKGYYQAPSGDLLVWNFTGWGVMMICFGGLQILIGMGLLSGRSWARWTAIGLTMLNIIGQIGFLKAYPAWTVIVIALDAFVLYALTARWGEAMEYDERQDRAYATDAPRTSTADRPSMPAGAEWQAQPGTNAPTSGGQPGQSGQSGQSGQMGDGMSGGTSA